MKPAEVSAKLAVAARSHSTSPDPPRVRAIAAVLTGRRHCPSRSNLEEVMMTHAMAQERLPSQPLAVQLRSDPTLLALDLGTTTGWALRAYDGLITSGTVSFRPSRYDGGGMRYLRFTNWLTEIDQLSGPIAAIWFEEVRRHAGTDAAHVYGGLMATLTAWAELRGVPYQGVPVGTWKKSVCGKGNADKAAVIAAMRTRGFRPADDNEADAIAILLWALETRGGVR
jgi:Holliday junction resolvasome RuvABC endonuclease subunit